MRIHARSIAHVYVYGACYLPEILPLKYVIATIASGGVQFSTGDEEEDRPGSDRLFARSFLSSR